MVAKRMKELVGIMLIGDGVLGFVEPRRHMRLWRSGPPAWQMMMDPFVRSPGLTRCISAAEAILGLWLASQQDPLRESDDAVPGGHPARTLVETR
jgi:hypothetical protein